MTIAVCKSASLHHPAISVASGTTVQLPNSLTRSYTEMKIQTISFVYCQFKTGFSKRIATNAGYLKAVFNDHWNDVQEVILPDKSV